MGVARPKAKDDKEQKSSGTVSGSQVSAELEEKPPFLRQLAFMNVRHIGLIRDQDQTTSDDDSDDDNDGQEQVGHGDNTNPTPNQAQRR